MAAERTEGAGVSGSLTITVDGAPVRLRPLTIEQAEAWQVLMGRLAAGVAVDTGLAPAELIAALMGAGTRTAIEALRAYDVDGVLGGAEGIRARMTPAELRTALEVVMVAAVPFDLEASRSVAMAFGGPTRVLAQTVAVTMMGMMESRRQAPSTPSPSGDGASDGTASDASGPLSSSSSDGSTPTSSTGKKPSPVATPSLTA